MIAVISEKGPSCHIMHTEGLHDDNYLAIISLYIAIILTFHYILDKSNTKTSNLPGLEKYMNL